MRFVDQILRHRAINARDADRQRHLDTEKPVGRGPMPTSPVMVVSAGRDFGPAGDELGGTEEQAL